MSQLFDSNLLGDILNKEEDPQSRYIDYSRNLFENLNKLQAGRITHVFSEANHCTHWLINFIKCNQSKAIWWSLVNFYLSPDRYNTYFIYECRDIYKYH